MNRVFLIFFLSLSIVTKGQIQDFEHIDFQKADSIALHYKGESLKKYPLLVHNLTQSLPTQVEKFRAIYTWVSTNIENDYLAYVRNRNKRKKFQKDSVMLKEWDKLFMAKVFKKLRKENKTVCTGYAYLIKEMLEIVDIPCKIIDGYGRTTTANVEELLDIPNHSWNVVQINQKWYLCDATWSSGIFYIDENRFEFDYNDGYFLAEPELFIKDHYPLDTAWILTEKKPTLEEFVKFPMIYKYAFNYPIIPLIPKNMHLKAIKSQVTTFLLEVPNPDNISTEDIKLELVSGSNKSFIQPEVSYKNTNLLELKCTFNHSGYYDLHIKIKDDYMVTYTVKVKKK